MGVFSPANRYVIWPNAKSGNRVWNAYGVDVWFAVDRTFAVKILDFSGGYRETFDEVNLETVLWYERDFSETVKLLWIFDLANFSNWVL